MSATMIKQQNGNINYENHQSGGGPNLKFDDDFVQNNGISKQNNNSSSVRNHQFKPPSPLFQQKPHNEEPSSYTFFSNTINENSHSTGNGKISNIVINNVLGRTRSNSNRSRRTSTPPFSTTDLEEDEICNKNNQSSNQAISVTPSSPLSACSSPKIVTKKRSSSSFMKKLSFKFKSSSKTNLNQKPENQSTEYINKNNTRNHINDNNIQSETNNFNGFNNNYSNKYGSMNGTSSGTSYIDTGSFKRISKMSTMSTQTSTNEFNKSIVNSDITSNVNIDNMKINEKNDSKNSNSDYNSKVKGEGTQLDLEAMQKVFNVFDSDHDGSITIKDVEKVMNSIQNLKDEIEMPSVDQIKVAFDKFDANKNGSIEFEEFLEILRCAGAQNSASENTLVESKQKNTVSNLSSKPTYNQNNQNLNNNHTNTNESKNSTNSITINLENSNNCDPDRVKTNMRIMFEQFDKDNDGKITKPELHFVMRNLFPDEVITDRDIDVMLRAADLDQNGFIDFDEFANMFMLHNTNSAVTPSIDPVYSPAINNNGPNLTKTYSTKKNTSITNLKSEREFITRSNKSLSRTLSRSNSKDTSRSRNPSGQRGVEHTTQDSPSNFKKVVQIFTTSQMMDLKAAFHMFDKNGDNKISEKELFEVMEYLGVKATEKEVAAMIQVVDKNKNGCVDYDEFIQMMTKTSLKPLSQEDELRKTFNIFDINGDGFINHDEIKTTMNHLGEKISDDEVKDMIRAADKNGDGQIDINEFSGLLNGTNVFKS